MSWFFLKCVFPSCCKGGALRGPQDTRGQVRIIMSEGDSIKEIHAKNRMLSAIESTNYIF